MRFESGKLYRLEERAGFYRAPIFVNEIKVYEPGDIFLCLTTEQNQWGTKLLRFLDKDGVVVETHPYSYFTVSFFKRIE